MIHIIFLLKIYLVKKFNNLEIILHIISLEISSIQDRKEKIFNENEELFEGSFFNLNINFTFNKNINNSYLMIISIKTKTRKRPSSFSTSINESKIYLNISKANCTMDEVSNNYC